MTAIRLRTGAVAPPLLGGVAVESSGTAGVVCGAWVVSMGTMLAVVVWIAGGFVGGAVVGRGKGSLLFLKTRQPLWLAIAQLLIIILMTLHLKQHSEGHKIHWRISRQCTYGNNNYAFCIKIYGSVIPWMNWDGTTCYIYTSDSAINIAWECALGHMATK